MIPAFGAGSAPSFQGGSAASSGGNQTVGFGDNYGSQMVMGGSASWQNYVLAGVAALALVWVFRWVTKSKK